MKPNSIEDIKKQLTRSQLQAKNLLEEVQIKSRVIQILLASGELNKVKLELATELAGGI